MFKNIYKVIETYTKSGQVRLTVLWLFNVFLTLTGNANSLIQIEKAPLGGNTSLWKSIT